jgi:hypothetical protein
MPGPKYYRRMNPTERAALAGEVKTVHPSKR